MNQMWKMKESSFINNSFSMIKHLLKKEINEFNKRALILVFFFPEIRVIARKIIRVWLRYDARDFRKNKITLFKSFSRKIMKTITVNCLSATTSQYETLWFRVKINCL